MPYNIKAGSTDNNCKNCGETIDTGYVSCPSCDVEHEIDITSFKDMKIIPIKEYELLLKRDEVLSCLEAAGVDNWDGYDSAFED